MSLRVKRQAWRPMKFCAAALMLVAAAPVLAASVISIHLPWSPPVAKGGTTAVYVDLAASDGASLVDVASTIARRVKLRGPGVTSEPSPSIALPAGTVVHLKPGAARIVLIGTTRTLRVGDHVPLTLTIRRADGGVERASISAEVRHASAADEEAHEHHHAR